METKRKVGIEMEGYIDCYPEDVEIYGVKIKKDGSLENYDWDEDEPYGVELVTGAITNLDGLRRTWEEMDVYNWETDECAGTHIHVDISDYSAQDIFKLLGFAKAIEKIMFMFADSYRYNNEYSCFLQDEWKKAYGIVEDQEWDAMSNKLKISKFLDDQCLRFNFLDNWKYNWLNVLSTSYPTAEFRIFHAVEDINELISQIRTVEAIVNLVKCSSVEQLEYIADTIFKQDNCLQVAEKFFEVLGLDFNLPLRCHEAMRKVEQKVEENKRQRIAV